MTNRLKRTFLPVFLLCAAAVFPRTAGAEGSAKADFALNLSATALNAKGQDTQWETERLAIETTYEKAAEFIGRKEKAALKDLTPQGWKSVWEADMKKMLKAVNITLQVSKAAEKAAGGEYDEAVLELASAGAEYMGNPVIKLTVAAIVYTNESYKQVRETGAARDIEALYGALDGDRLVLGKANAQAEQPALIPLDNETVETIYQNYIWEDTNTRNLVAAYFNKKGVGWSEEEWRRVRNAYIADAWSADPKRIAEYQELHSAFRKKTLPWIKILIKDVNEQARLRWGEMRLRQAANGLGPYVQRLNSVSREFAALENRFKALETTQKNIPEWRTWLSESPAAVASAKKLLADPGKGKPARQLCETWLSRMRTAVSGAHVLGETQLFNALKVQQQAWYDIETALGGMVGKQQEALVKDPTLVYTPRAEEPITEEKRVYQENFETFMKPYARKTDPAQALPAIVAALNRGDFDAAERLIADFDQELGGIQAYYGYDSYNGGYYSCNDKGLLLVPVIKARDSLNEAARGEITAISEQADATQQKILDAEKERRGIPAGRTAEMSARYDALGTYIKQYQQQIAEYNTRIAKHKREIDIRDKAYELAFAVNDALSHTTTDEHFAKRNELLGLIAAARGIQELRRGQWGQYQASVKAVLGGIDYSREMAPQLAALDAALEKVKKEDKFAANAPFDHAETIGELYSQLQQRAGQINVPVDTQEADQRLEAVAAAFSKWDDAAGRWVGIAAVPADELAEIGVLVDAEGAMAYATERNNIDNLINGIPALKADIKRKAEEYLSLADDITKERREGALWLEDKIREIKGFFKAQENLKLLKNKGTETSPEYEAEFEEADGMAITNTPYRHYMLQSDLAAYAQSVEKGWEAYEGFKFIKTHAPQVYAKLKAAAVPDVKPAAEENVIARTGESASITLWGSVLDKFEKAAGGVKYNASDLDFSLQMLALQNITGLESAIIPAAADKKVRYAAADTYKKYPGDYDNTLGGRYIGLLAAVQNTFDAREEYLKTQKTGPTDQPFPPLVPPVTDPATEAVGAMYSDFRAAYEARNESRVLKFISPDWDAGDGTTMSELSGYLRNIFTVFNEVRCSIIGLRVTKKSEGTYKAVYTMVITGRIFDQNIRHEERSTVEEEVVLTDRGNPVIAKTIKGNFWEFK
ncbi:MAG: hypothetical protein A2X30_12100 [Elusimicrobia bacterium GWB2_63_16]|nr:MAG: hypothetical protein A2X30_12100 [Elusimicrobia bacterium GWB2_63_16]